MVFCGLENRVRKGEKKGVGKAVGEERMCGERGKDKGEKGVED